MKKMKNRLDEMQDRSYFILSIMVVGLHFGHCL